jgi:16S rRNA C967 or C1407 C5-methylase (RsmB/RsmF family)/NOL1/NOP2/fmu family ribosome biogenesis protein
MHEIIPDSLPIPFIDRIHNQLGGKAEAFLQSLKSEAHLSFRRNPSKWHNDLPFERVPWCSTGYYLQKRPLFTLDPWFHAGAYYVQEPGSMLLEQAFNAVITDKPALILDLCGAPGGKSTHLHALMKPTDLLITNEVIRSRAIVLQEIIQKWGYSNTIVTNSDPDDFTRLKDLFDIVVVDAPCSGEGLFRKDRESVKQWTLNNTNLCEARQRRIISAAWDCLKPDGYLIYSTCTFNPGENIKNAKWLVRNKNAESVEINLEDEWNVVPIIEDGVTGYQTFPHLTKAEGFFITVIRKCSRNDTGFKLPKEFSKKAVKISNKQNSFIKEWIKESGEYDFIQRGEEFYYFPLRWQHLLYQMEKKVKILQAGSPVAIIKGHVLIPHAGLALATQFNSAIFPVSELPIKEAIGFLRKDDLKIGSFEKGWVLINYKGMPLGWVKNLGKRVNNHYPKEWRIRMPAEQLSDPWHL